MMNQPSEKPANCQTILADEDLSPQTICSWGEQNRYRLDCIKSGAQMDGIKGQWRELEIAQSLPYTYFQNFDWCRKWIANNAIDEASDSGKNPGCIIRIYAVYCDDALVMVWPLMIAKSGLGIKILTTLGEPLSQYSNFIYHPEKFDKQAGMKTWKCIRKHARVDAVTFNHYPKDSLLDKIVNRYGVNELSRRAASMLDLTQFESWEEYHSTLSRNNRKQRERRRKKLERIGPVKTSVHLAGTPEFEKLTTQALTMKLDWLSNTGRTNKDIEESATREFLLSLNARIDEQTGRPDGAVIHALSVKDEVIALEIGMCLGGHYYSYLGAFDWDWREFSPGKVQIESAQKWAKEIGMETFDFLGDPSHYKVHWSDTQHRLVSKCVPLSLSGFVYCVTWKAYLRPAAKYLYQVVGINGRKRLHRILGACREIREKIHAGIPMWQK